MNDLTIVTGIWDLGRDRAGRGFERSFEHYRTKFAQLLEADVPMVVFGDEELRPFVQERRRNKTTDFRVRPATYFRDHFDFYDRVQEIRKDPAWLAQAGWLPDSTQATMPLYNPMVMSKMFMLHDASIWNPFGTGHLAWIDGGITHTVHPGTFTRDRCFDRVEQLLESFFFVSFPYEGGREIHGFAREGMKKYCGEDPTFVCRGGFFGGHIDCLPEVNEHYYGLLAASLHDGYMGTEESIFTLMAHEEPELYDRYPLREEHQALLLHFFEHVKGLPASVRQKAGLVEGKASRRIGRRRRGAIDVSRKTVAGYVVTFNASDQLAAVLESWTKQIPFDRLYVLDNSTDVAEREHNRRVAREHDAVELSHPKGNGGICGGRQLAAEHFDGTGDDYYIFIEDDMFLNSSVDAGVCRNGFRRSVPNLREVLLKIMESEGYDFLKLSYTEFYGDNGTQFSWYNVPQVFRLWRWPEKPKLPAHGLDPDAPATEFGRIGTVDGVSYIDGEVYYCNWPQIVSREGNRRMFLDTVFEHPYEQTWMSHMYQLTLKGELRPAVLLASPITHNRFHHYDAELRRENGEAELPSGGRVSPRVWESGGATVDLADLTLHHMGRSGLRPYVVVIGAMDGVSFDEFCGYISKYEWSGLFVEPIPEQFRRLRENHAQLDYRPDNSYECSAVAEHDGTVEMMTIQQEAVDSGKVHPSFGGMSAISPPRNGLGSTEDAAVVARYGEVVTVNCLTLKTLFERHEVDRVDLLSVDAEGWDYRILRQLDFSAYRPKMIRCEYINLPPDEKEGIKALLEGKGYIIRIVGQNIDAVEAKYWEEVVAAGE